MSEAKSDERLKVQGTDNVRGSLIANDAERTQQDGTMYSLEERRRMMRSDWNQEILPTPPAVPGWHFCWLSTTNSSDPIFKRMQKGYVPVQVAEVPGFAEYKITEGEFQGCVSCNEMLLFKIEEELYQEVMAYFHYELPNEEEDLLRANLAKQDKDSSGRTLAEQEGFETLARAVRRPTF